MQKHLKVIIVNSIPVVIGPVIKPSNTSESGKPSQSKSQHEHEVH